MVKVVFPTVWPLVLAVHWGHLGSCPHGVFMSIRTGLAGFLTWLCQGSIAQQFRQKQSPLRPKLWQSHCHLFHILLVKGSPRSAKIQRMKKQTPPLDGICCREFSLPSHSSGLFPYVPFHRVFWPLSFLSSLNSACSSAFGLEISISHHLEYSFSPVFSS